MNEQFEKEERNIEDEYRGYFGQRYHIVTAHTTHICKICQGEIQPETQCIRVFKPVIAEKSGIRKHYGFYQIFYHIECVKRDFEKWKFLNKLQYELQIRKCLRLKCPNFVDGLCIRKIGSVIVVNDFNGCDRQ